MFDSRGAVLLTPPGWDDEDPPDLGDWEPVPTDLWNELRTTAPFWPDEGDIPLNDQAVRDAADLPLGAHTLRLLTETAVGDMSPEAKALALRRTRELIASMAGPKPADPHEDWGAFDVAVADKCSVYAADRKVALARQLTGRHRATRDAMCEGRITQTQARMLVEGVAHLPDEIALTIEARLLKFSHRQDLPKFKASLRRWLARLDPSWKERAETARTQITVEHTANDDGTGDIWIRGPLEQTATLDTALKAYASATKQAHGGTSPERKLAGLVEWAERYLTSPEAPRRHGRAAVVNLCIDPPTMFAMADHPVEIIGYGMVPAEAAITLLAEGSPIRRLIIDEHDGHLLHYGTETYVVPPALADHLIALHATSAAPHSSVAAADCDMEHNLPHAAGGATDPDNNTPVDRRWHRAKTHAGWTYLKNKDGTVDWTSPSGLTQRVDPHDYRLGP